MVRLGLFSGLGKGTQGTDGARQGCGVWWQDTAWGLGDMSPGSKRGHVRALHIGGGARRDLVGGGSWFFEDILA